MSLSIQRFADENPQFAECRSSKGGDLPTNRYVVLRVFPRGGICVYVLTEGLDYFMATYLLMRALCTVVR